MVEFGPQRQMTVLNESIGQLCAAFILQAISKMQFKSLLKPTGHQYKINGWAQYRYFSLLFFTQNLCDVLLDETTLSQLE